jgi:hypothetical protein
MVCDVCRIEGFQVEKNARPNDSVDEPVAILASRKNGDENQRIAFECWEGERQVNGREVEKFVQRLRELELPSGIYVSPKGFTGDAEFIARKLGVELWDLAKLRDHLEKIKSPESNQVPGTLPVSRIVASKILPSEIENWTSLRLISMPKLEFRPYFFVNFNVKTGKTRAKGVAVFDGVDGRYCDGLLSQGQLKNFRSSGLFADCLGIEPVVGSMPDLPAGLEMKNNVSIASPGTTEQEITQGTIQLLREESGVHPEDVTITKTQLLHVPLATVQLVAGQRSYTKILQAATAKIILDETSHCTLCDTKSSACCEDCGNMTCTDHTRLCSSCRKHMCTKCATTKGVLNKAVLCHNCIK